ncbi:MAG: TM2 domain-containing protein [Saonia sp.]
MRLKLILLFSVIFLVIPNSYASFPVSRSIETGVTETEVLSSPAIMQGAKSQGVAILLWFFLGVLAAHRWYLGSPWYWNVLFILTLGGLGVWWVIDLVDIITKNYPTKGGFKSDFF